MKNFKTISKLFLMGTVMTAGATFTSCNDDADDMNQSADFATAVTQADLQSLQNSLVGEYEDLTLQDYGLCLNYKCQSDSVFSIVALGVDSTATANCKSSGDAAFEVTRGCMENRTEDELAKYKNVVVDEMTGKWHSFIDYKHGEKKQGIVWSITGADQKEYSDTIYVETINGTIATKVKHDVVCKLLQDGRPETRGFFDVLKKVAQKVLNTYVKVANWLYNAVTFVTEWTPRITEGMWNTLTGNLQEYYSDPKNYMGDTNQGYWMSKLDKDIPLYQVSIPGTHDSFSFLSEWSCLVAQTQMLTIQGQWETGVRYFDVRIDAGTDTDKDMRVCHGVITYDKSALQALKDIKKMLDSHPGETVVVSIKTDSDGKYDTKENYAKINAMVKEAFGNKLFDWKKDFASTGLRMGSLRDKVVVLSRLSYPEDMEKEQVWPTIKSGENGTQYLALGGENIMSYGFQDFYCPRDFQSDNSYISEKENKFAQFLSDNKHANGFAVNATSGYCGNVACVNYFKTAHSVAPFAESLIKKMSADETTGIIMLDYAGAEGFDGSMKTGTKTIAKTIIDHNFK